jgi:hypothetical protein
MGVSESLKVFWRILSVVIVLVIAFVLIVIANRGEEKYTAEYLGGADSPSPSVSVTPSVKPSVSPSPSTSPSPKYSGPVDPLTGLPAEKDISTSRPYAIMINNISVAQPQLGVSKADIIYEILVEGGITRMMAVYQDISDIGEIGSIRSARPYFVDIADSYDAIYIHAGGSPDAYEEFVSTAVTHLDGVNGKKQDIFYRDKARQKKMGMEHSLVTTSDLIEKFLPKYGIPLTHDNGFKINMAFSDGALTGGTAAGSVKVHFSSSKTTSFTYSPEDQLYYISQYGKSYTDGNNSTKMAVSNVLILRTRINVIAGDDKGRIDVDTVGSGKGYFICNGKYVEISWSRKSTTDQFRYTLANGSPLVYSPGKTYVCIINTKDAVDYK